MSTRPLPCRLTDGELLDRARTIGQALNSIEALKSDRRATVKDIDEQIKELRDNVRRLGAELASGEQERETDVEWRFDWREGTKSLVRLDLNVAVEQVPITDEERQGRLFLLENKCEAEDEAQVGEDEASQGVA